MDGVVHPNVEQAIGRDRIRKALKRYENRPADEHRYGIVRSVNEDGSYEVLLDGDVQTSRCVAGCTAGVGDRVLVCIMANGRCAATARLEGEYAEFAKPVLCNKGMRLKNGYALTTLDANGDVRSLISGEDGYVYIGYGGYDDSYGETRLYGNKINVYSRGGNAINQLNGGVILPEGADLNDYVTVGNYYSNNSTLSSSLKNTPYTGGSLSLKVICPYGTSVSGNSTIVQEMTISNGRQYWRRTGDTGATWTDWYLNLCTRDVLDYPTAQGTSGGWNYWKFNNGLAIVSRRVTVSSKIATAWGGVYESASYWSYNYPFTFTALPAVSISISGSPTGGLLGVEISEAGSTSTTPYFLLTRGATGGSTTYSADVGIIAIGKWK